MKALLGINPSSVNYRMKKQVENLLHSTQSSFTLLTSMINSTLFSLEFKKNKLLKIEQFAYFVIQNWLTISEKINVCT